MVLVLVLLALALVVLDAENKKTSQAHGQQENTLEGNWSLAISKDSENGGVDNKKVSLEGGTLTLDDRINVLEKYMQPMSLCSVQVSSKSDQTVLVQVVSSVKLEIGIKIQMNFNQGIRRVIRDKTYTKVKLLKKN